MRTRVKKEVKKSENIADIVCEWFLIHLAAVPPSAMPPPRMEIASFITQHGAQGSWNNNSRISKGNRDARVFHQFPSKGFRQSILLEEARTDEVSSLTYKVTRQLKSYILLQLIWGIPPSCWPLRHLVTAQAGQRNSPN